jgi:phage/plasmid-like protein (TIGR03299 family)
MSSMNSSSSINDALAADARSNIIAVDDTRVATWDAAEFAGQNRQARTTNHQITITDRLATYKTRGWHGLGEVVEEGLGGEDAVKRILPWYVEEQPVFCEIDGVRRPLPAKVTVRSDTREVLGMVGADYQVIQNLAIGQFADALVGQDAALTMESCGSLLGGRKVFLLVRVPRECRVGATGADVTVPYLLLATGHDGSMAMSVTWTFTRVVCNNTYTSALGAIDGDVAAGRAFRIRHTRNAAEAVNEARRALAIAAKGADRFEELARQMASATMDASGLAAYFRQAYAGIYGPVNETSTLEQDETARLRRARVIGEWTELLDADTNRFDGTQGTLWAAFNCITEWQDTRRSPSVKGDRRVHTNLLGVSATAKRVAMRAAMAMV